MTTFTGKMSVFGGPQDTGVSRTEGLALIEWPDLEQWWFNRLFLPEYARQTGFGLARILNPAAFYVACRWDYKATPREKLRHAIVKLTANGKTVFAQAADWGPNENTGRVADLSPGAAQALGLRTDDEVKVELIF